MSITIKTPEDIEKLRVGGQRLAQVVAEVIKRVAPGVTTGELDEFAEKMIRDMGDEPAFLGYKPAGVPAKYPATLCVSINDEVVHGIPDGNIILQEGDIVTIDCGLKHQGLFTDHAITVPVGAITPEDQKLLNVTREALMVGIKAAQAGATTGDVGHAIESFVDGRYGTVRILSGHGVGYAVHEEPYVPNFGVPGKGDRLVPGMVIAIEPMLTRGSDDVVGLDDHYTYVTEDGSRSAHFEHTILITEDGPEILTKE